MKPWLAALLLVCSCATPAAPKARFKEMEFQGLDLRRSSWKILLEVENENFVGATVSALEYEAFLDGKPVGSGALKDGVTIAGSSASEVSLPIEIPHSSVAVAAELLKGRTELPYRLRGSARILGIPIPFEKSGVYAVPPEIAEQARGLGTEGAKKLIQKLYKR